MFTAWKLPQWNLWNPYALAAQLKGHSSRINTVAVSHNRKLLASGGMSNLIRVISVFLSNHDIGGDGVRVWDMHTSRQMPVAQSISLHGRSAVPNGCPGGMTHSVMGLVEVT